MNLKHDANEALFRREERELFISRFRFCAYFLVVPLILLFALVDLYFPTELILTILKARLLSIPVCIACVALYRSRIVREKYFTFPAYLCAVYLGCYLAYLVSYTGYEVSPYYAGLNLVGIAAFSFLPWDGWLPMFVAGTILYGPYLAVLAFGYHGPREVSYLIPHLAFCVATVGIAVVTNLSMRRLRRREIASRLRLMQEIASKNKIIDQKTREGIYLERLAHQFSPQIIEGVKGGRISLEGLARKIVTSVFIDVESSTKRSIRLDHSDYTKTLSEFFTDAVALLLKHNVTVATYLGDGLLAFTNAPEENAKHRESAVEACLEILKMHARRRNYYLEKWRTDFNIRIGINSGEAFVGFFPSFQLGTYTAIGASVNLAARLCARALPNSILVTKAFLRETSRELQGVTVRFVRTDDAIKGFEGERFELCSIEPKAQLGERGTHACPQCAGEVVESNNLGDYLIVKCIACGYSDLVGIRAIAAR